MTAALRQVARLTLSFTVAAVLGCSLLLDTSDIDAGCGDDRKVCNGRCVSNQDPAFGCRLTRCAPCELPNAVPACEAGECRVRACLYGFGCPDCRANLLTDEFNCGECGTVCASGMLCSDGSCIAHP